MFIEYNFYIYILEKYLYFIYYKLIFVLLSGKGDIWLVLCIVLFLLEKNIGDVVILDYICIDYYIYLFEGR